MIKMGRIEYNKLSSAVISEKRNIVISECSKGGFTLGQQMTVEDGKSKIDVFLKSAIHINNLEGLYNLRDALNVAIEKVEEK